MNAPDPAFRNQIIQERSAIQDSGVDLVFVARGGATALLTTLFKLHQLQEFLPHHLTDYRPYYLADSAGAYATYGLVAPSLTDPTRPCMTPSEIFADFLSSSPSYLSPNREIARQALIAHAGRPRISDSISPITISTVDITNNWKRAYFTHFPNDYMADHPQFVRPVNRNDHNFMDDAVLASSAFAVLLGAHKIDASADASSENQIRRAMDMAFTETHNTNLHQYAHSHRTAFSAESKRRVVCVILGNNYLNFNSAANQTLSPARMNRHLPDIVRYLSHSDLVSFAENLFGQDNVFDLSLMMPQDVTKKNDYRLPLPFRGDPDAILRRYEWTKHMLDQDVRGYEQIQKLAHIIRQEAQPIPSAPLLDKTGDQRNIDEQVEILRKKARRSPVAAIGADFAATVGPVSTAIASQAKPAVDVMIPVAQGIQILLQSSWTKAIVPAAKGISRKLGQTWDQSVHPYMARVGASWWNTCFPQSQIERPALRSITNITPPLPTHSSEPHTPSESGYTPL